MASTKPLSPQTRASGTLGRKALGRAQPSAARGLSQEKGREAMRGKRRGEGSVRLEDSREEN